MSGLLDKPWSHAPSLVPPVPCLRFHRAQSSETPTARRFASIFPTRALALSATGGTQRKIPVHPQKTQQLRLEPQRNRQQGLRLPPTHTKSRLLQSFSAGEKLCDALIDRVGRVLEVLLLVLLAELHAFVLRVQLPER